MPTPSPTLKSQNIPLDALVVHPSNVRAKGGYQPDGITRLANNIAKMGLFQALVTQPLDDGKHGVLGGGRRLAALQELAAKGRLTLTKIPCRAVAKDLDAPTAISLAENEFQEPMSPIDAYEAYASVVDENITVADIAAIFGVTERDVKQRLSYGRVHADIRAATRDRTISLDVMKAFAGHPSHETQKKIFDALTAERRLSVWSVGEAIQNADVRLSDQIGRFVNEAYVAKKGDVIPALLPEDTVLSDRCMVDEIALDQLHAMAAEIAAKHGFAWADAQLETDYVELSAFDRIYPSRAEPDEKTAETLEALELRMDALGETIEQETDHEKLTELETEWAELDAEKDRIEADLERYDSDAAKTAGVMVTFSDEGPNFHLGLVKRDDKADAKASIEDDHETARPVEKTGKLSQALQTDISVERGDAVAASLLEDQELALDGLFFVVARKCLVRQRYMQGVHLQCEQSERKHSQPSARASANLDAIEGGHGDLDLSWLDASLDEGEQFLAFRAIPAKAKHANVAWCMGRLMSPDLVDGDRERGSFVQTLAGVAVPDIRERWTPGKDNFWARVTKGYMLDVLNALGMSAEARTQASAKKAELAAYMGDLFKAPFATLTLEQHAAIANWTPKGMATTALMLADDEAVAA